jgi:hypothetical protein
LVVGASRLSNANYRKEALHYGFAFDPPNASKRQQIEVLKAFFDSQGEIDFLYFGKKRVRLIARWRNPDNKNPLHANWKTTDDPGQSVEDFYTTLHGERGALAKAAARVEREYAQLSRTSPIPRQRKAATATAITKRVQAMAKRKKVGLRRYGTFRERG